MSAPPGLPSSPPRTVAVPPPLTFNPTARANAVVSGSGQAAAAGASTVAAAPHPTDSAPSSSRFWTLGGSGPVDVEAERTWGNAAHASPAPYTLCQSAAAGGG